MADAVVTQRVLDDGTTIIDLRGELDIAVNDALRGVFLTVMDTRPPRLVVNMRHVKFVDSTGIGALVAGFNAAQEAGVDFQVHDVAPFVEKQLRAVGLYALLVPGSSTDRS